MKIGIYGGTFDPPHLGHVYAAEDAISALSLDKLIVIPDTVPPHKTLSERSAAAQHRFNMTKLAFSGVKGAEVSDIELRREGKSYTIQTLTELKKLFPGDELVLLMGTDMFLSFETWKEYEKIFSLAAVAVFPRNDEEGELIRRKKKEFDAAYPQSKTLPLDTVPFPVSSTQVRALLPERKGTELLSDEVYGYILKNRLYGVRPSFDYLRVKAYEMLTPKRVRHVTGCESEAVRLARRWGADEDKAREAAIFHDCTKKLTLPEQLELCEKYSIALDETERGEVKLLHSKTGAAIAEHEFGYGKDVADSIFWHTTAKKDMTLLEKIIYLADYIEPTREFEGLAELRRLCYQNIDAALLLGLEMSIDDMQERNIVPHVRSREAIEYLTEKIRKDKKGSITE